MAGKVDPEKIERFAQGLADGMRPAEAYEAAGYSRVGARAAASLLLKRHPEILDRRDAILKDRGKRLAKAPPDVVQMATMAAYDNQLITKERILHEMWDNAMKAKAAIPVLDRQGNAIGVYNANFAASNQALQLVGREIGLFLDKKAVPDSTRVEKTINDIEGKSDGMLNKLEQQLEALERTLEGK